MYNPFYLLCFLKNFKIDSKISHKSPQKSGIQNEYKIKSIPSKLVILGNNLNGIIVI